MERPSIELESKLSATETAAQQTEDSLRLRRNECCTGREVCSAITAISDFIWKTPDQQQRQILYHRATEVYSWRRLLFSNCVGVLVALAAGLSFDYAAFGVPCFFTFFCVFYTMLTSALMTLRLYFVLKRSVRAVDLFDAALFIVCAVCLNVYGSLLFGESPTNNQMVLRTNQMMNDEFEIGKTLLDVSNTQEFFSWLRGPFIDNFVCNDDPISNSTCYINDGKFMKVQYPRLRIVKQLPNENCDMQIEFCPLPRFYQGLEDRRHWEKEGVRVEWEEGTYINAGNDIRSDLPFTGRTAVYGGSGLTLHITGGKSVARETVGDLLRLGFIDVHTRAIFIDVVFASMVGRWGYARIQIETPLSGIWVIRPQVWTGPVDFDVLFLWPTEHFCPPNTHFGLFLLALVFQFLGTEFSDYRMLGNVLKARIKSGSWQMLNFALIICVFTSVAMKVHLVASYPLHDRRDGNATLPLLATSAYYYSQEKQLISMAVYLQWLACLQFLRFFPGLGIVTQTFQEAAVELLAFTLALLLVFIGFVSGFHYAFGEQVQEFSTFNVSFWTMMKALSGDFNAEMMYQADSSLGFLAFALFTTIIVFFILTMLLAIITDAFMIVQQRSREAKLRIKTTYAAKMNSLERWYKKSPGASAFVEGPGCLKGSPPYAVVRVVVWSADILNPQVLPTRWPFVRLVVTGVPPENLTDLLPLQQSAPLHNTDTPVFNFKSEVSIASSQCALKFEVWDKDSMVDGALGEATYELSQLLNGQHLSETLELTQTSNARTQTRLNAATGSAGGIIKISLSFWLCQKT